MLQVYQNLIENSIKYSPKNQKPHIHIGYRKDDKSTVLFVQDSGIGIKPEYHNSVFDIFHKLDPDTDGSGIGLAIVKRIITIQGGKIWIESDGNGTGTTFYFTLPIKE